MNPLQAPDMNDDKQALTEVRGILIMLNTPILLIDSIRGRSGQFKWGVYFRYISSYSYLNLNETQVTTDDLSNIITQTDRFGNPIKRSASKVNSSHFNSHIISI